MTRKGLRKEASKVAQLCQACVKRHEVCPSSYIFVRLAGGANQSLSVPKAQIPPNGYFDTG